MKCDLFVKFLEMAERNHRKSSALQMVVKTLLLADDCKPHSGKQRQIHSWKLVFTAEKGFSGAFWCRGGKGEVGCEVVKEHCFVVVPTYYN